MRTHPKNQPMSLGPAVMLFRAIITFGGVMIFSTVALIADDSVVPAAVKMTETPLSSKQAQAKQKEWADHLGFKIVFENSIGMQMCLIPPGTFFMGGPRGEPHRRNQEGPHKVTHSQPYFLGKYEVTQREWEQVMGPIQRQRKAGAGDRFPINAINHSEATEFCRRLTQLDHKAGKLPKGYAYRLPTDAEWEYACRAGTLTATYFGDKLSSSQANFDGSRPYNGAKKGPNLGKLAKVGSYPANAWGLYDMHGNLSEWCLDWYHARVKGGVDPVQLRPSPKLRKLQRLTRGGRFGTPGRYCRSASRYFATPENQSGVVGFRAVLTKLQPGQK